MKTFKVDLYEYFGLNRCEGAEGYLTAFINEPNDFNLNRIRPAMLVIPGGGYRYNSNAESDNVAIEYLAQGYCAFVLNYSVKPIGYPMQLIEACMAMIYIRENATQFRIDENMVGAIGFSAGGHLCACLGIICDEKEIIGVLGDKVELARPNAIILAYPVISSNEEIWHEGSFVNISNNDKELAKRLSLENRVNTNSAPAFIWATLGDKTVPCENSMSIALAYKKAGVPFELHIFERGRHGLCFANRETGEGDLPAKEWVKMAHAWLKERGFDLVD